MKHVDYFKNFFNKIKRGTAKDICAYMVSEGAIFNCVPERRCTSVNRQISRECGKSYPTGDVYREKNSNGIYEYFTK